MIIIILFILCSRYVVGPVAHLGQWVEDSSWATGSYVGDTTGTLNVPVETCRVSIKTVWPALAEVLQI